MMVANEPGTRAALVSKRLLLIASSQPETRPSVNVIWTEVAVLEATQGTREPLRDSGCFKPWSTPTLNPCHLNASGLLLRQFSAVRTKSTFSIALESGKLTSWRRRPRMTTTSSSPSWQSSSSLFHVSSAKSIIRETNGCSAMCGEWTCQSPLPTC
jgi:hypothetical protein